MKRMLFILAGAITLASCAGEGKKETAAETRTDSTVTMAGDTATAGISSVDTAAVVTRDAEGIDLRFNLQRGRTYSYVMDFDMDQAAEGKKMSNNMGWKFNMQVVDEAQKIKTIRATYDRIDMKMDFGGQQMQFSSDLPEEQMNHPLQMISKMFAAIKGKSIMLKVDDKGTIRSITGFDEISKAMANAVPLPEEVKAKMMESFREQFNDDAAKQMFAQTFAIFPDKKVKLGDSWEKASIVGTPAMKQEATTTYTVSKINGNRVTLDTKSKLRVQGGDNDASGTQVGQLIVDARTGLVLNGSFEQNLKGNGKIVGRGKITGKEM